MRTRKHKPHIAHLLTVSLVWLILSANAAASDWFVRPAGGSYGSEDGSSYENAWDGLPNVVWGGAGVVAGDTLYICGLHLREHTEGSALKISPDSGTSENRITIRGDYPGDAGIVWGAAVLAHEAWADEGSDTWSITLPKRVGSMYVFEDVTADSWTVLTKVDSFADVQTTPGSYYSLDYREGSRFYVHTSDSESPANRIAVNRIGYLMKVNERHYITWQNLKFYSMYRWLDTFDGHYATNITWNNVTNWYGTAFHIDDYSHDIEFIDCDLGWQLGAIIVAAKRDEIYEDPYNILIQGCTIHDIGIGWDDSDSHAIVIGDVHNAVIERNEIYNAGSGITNYSFPLSRGMENVIIRWNYMHNMHMLGGSNARGIELNGANTIAVHTGVEVYGNVVANIEGVAYRVMWPCVEQVVFYNNIAYNTATSFYFHHGYDPEKGPKIIFKNNLSLYPALDHVAFSYGAECDDYVLNSDYNIFYPVSGDDFAFHGGKTFEEWQALSKTGCTFDPHSIVADPLFVDPDNGNFNLIPGSLAIDAGVDVGLTQDFEGNPIPLGSAPDIGAYEAVIDPDNPPPVLQAIGDKSVNENVTLTFTINATDSEPVTYLAQSLPSGATLDSQTGDFAWTPSYTQAGSYQVRFFASDGNSSDSETITITVTNVNRAPVLGAISDQSVDENSILSFSVDATDPDGQALSYSVSGLPTGAVFASQTFTWTPSFDQAGAFAVTFTADDGQDQDSQEMTITVINVNRTPVLAAINNKSVWSDDPLTFTVNATDPDGDEIIYSVDTLPSGAAFADQDFDWTPSQDQGGSYAVTFTASDGQLQNSQPITITVNVDSLAPTVTNSSPAADSIQAPLNNLINLNITDAGKGINADLVTIKVNNNIVYSGNTNKHSSIYGECYRIGTKANYRFIYQPNEVFDYDQTVSITASATDLAGNAMNEQSYSFVTEMRSFGKNKKVDLGNLKKGRPATVRDSFGDIWAVWHAGPIGGSRDIYIGKLAADEEYFSDGIKLTESTADQCNPVIAIGSDNKLYVAWQDDRHGNWDIYVSTSDDGTAWSTETMVNEPENDPINPDPNQVNPVIVINGENLAYVVWQDDREGNQDIFVAASSDGFATKNVSQITADTSDQVEPAIAADSDNTIYVVWTDMRNSGKKDIYGAASNNGPWTNVPVVAEDDGQSSPAIATEADGSILHLVWVDDRLGDDDIFYDKTSGGLTLLTGSSIIDPLDPDEVGTDQISPVIITTGYTGNDLRVFACWRDERNADADLYCVEIRSGDDTNVFVGDDGTNSDQSEPAIGIDGDGYPYLVWTNERTNICYAGSTFMADTLASTNVSISSTATVGTVWNAVNSLDDASAEVPRGAYLCDVKITISRIKNPPKSNLALDRFSGTYEFGPSGMEFIDPVTITIPYEVNGSENVSYTAYWYNPLTDTLSQQGITDVETIVISPTLHALRFKTTHFSAFILGGAVGGALLGGGGGGGGCSVSADAEGNIVEFILPYIGLAIVMAMLKVRDARYRKARSMAAGKC